jgi:drug/metabolite transporter (DMT)-like permease
MKSKAHGYLFALAATTIFSLQDAVSKHLGDHYSPIFITMIRYWAFGAFCILMVARKRGGLRAAASTTRPLLQIVRGVLLAVEIMIVIAAFAHAGLAHSTAVLSATPILVTLLSIPLLGERVGWRRWSAIIAGLVGVLLILKPDASGFLDPWLLLPVVCSVMYAIYLIATRLVSRTDGDQLLLYRGRRRRDGDPGRAVLLGRSPRVGPGLDGFVVHHRDDGPLPGDPRL